jgi:hypothetical protein
MCLAGMKSMCARFRALEVHDLSRHDVEEIPPEFLDDEHDRRASEGAAKISDALMDWPGFKVPDRMIVL